MRINSTDTQRTTGPEPERSGSRANSSPVDGLGSDVASLSSEHSRVQALAAAVAQLPEIRQSKVAALAEKIHSGTYDVTPQQTAAALFSAMAALPAA